MRLPAADAKIGWRGSAPAMNTPERALYQRSVTDTRATDKTSDRLWGSPETLVRSDATCSRHLKMNSKKSIIVRSRQSLSRMPVGRVGLDFSAEERARINALI